MELLNDGFGIRIYHMSFIPVLYFNIYSVKHCIIH